MPGNRIWEARSSTGGSPPLFADPDDLWAACVGYFEWAAANPLFEDQLVTYLGSVRHEPMPRMRAMTKGGLCIYLGIAHSTWNAWRRERPELLPAIKRAESVIWVQKFTGAAAGMLSESIVARELGLARKAEVNAGVQEVAGTGSRAEFTRRIDRIADRLREAEAYSAAVASAPYKRDSGAA
jgi:hypothetical protein